MKNKYIILLAIALGFFSCKPEMKEGFEPSKGQADFSHYVALGNSLTAGYADGALYHSSQKASYANLLATQLKEVGGGEFKQPDIASEFGVLPGKLELVVVDGNLAPAPVITDPANLEGFYPPVGYPIDNMGVPGAKVGHLLAPGYGNINNLAAGLANPYFIRMASSPDISVIEQALVQAPTFFSLWIGNNDVLGYASTGGVGDIITPEANFTAYYANLAQAINNTGAKGVLANIPSISGAAYFNTVPGNALQIDAPTAGALNAGISAIEAQVNQILAMAGLDPFSYGITFNAGANAFLIEDNNFPYKALFNAIADTSTNVATKIFLRQAQFRQIDLSHGELLTLRTPQDSLKMGMGSFMPIGGVMMPFGIPNRYVLDQEEIVLVNNAITTFNNIIKATADQYGWAYVDINSKFDEMKDGVIIDGVSLNADYVTGGIFSLDGIHLTPRGNAAVSNFFIEAINNKYGSAISTVNISEYPAVTFPDE